MFYSCAILLLAVTIIGAADGHIFGRPENLIDTDRNTSTLVLTHVLFRHGNRTGQKDELYPKDPYLNYDYFPFGNGQLTNEGKRKEYSIGQALRRRYGNFLGPYYYPEIIEAWSTDYNRTKMSLELVLASLFAPKGLQVWSEVILNWQPVPYNYIPTSKDKVLIGMNCPTYTKEIQEIEKSDKYKQSTSKHLEAFNYISSHTGLNITRYEQVYNLFFGLSTEEEWGFKLPKWTDKVWPAKILELAIEEYYVHLATTNLRKMAVGYFLQKIIDYTKKKIKNINVKNGRRMYLYSAHENNVAEFLLLLDIFRPPHVPTYGSYIVVEVHRIKGVYGIKIFYENYVTSHFELKKLPACDEFCPLDKFETLIAEYIPSDDLCGI